MDQTEFSTLCDLLADKYEAFLYDCDGTLADNMPLHTETYLEVAKTYNVAIDTDIIYELAGWPISEVVVEINKRYGSAMDPEEFKARKAEIYMERYIDTIRPIPHVVKHLSEHAGKKRIAVVSGGDRKAIEKTLKVLRVSHLVELLVCSGDTALGKPFPDPFLRAAELLKIEPERCLVFEDGEPGVTAAKAAGMGWIRVDTLAFG